MLDDSKLGDFIYNIRDQKPKGTFEQSNCLLMLFMNFVRLFNPKSIKMSIKRVVSASDMAAQLNKHIQIKQIDNFFAEKAGALSTMLAGTQGRDRMCALIQYSFKFYYACSRNSDDESWNKHWSVNAALRVSQNVSLSRKMLKFLNFVQALQKAYVFYLFKQHKSFLTKVCVQSRHISSFFLYLSDNVIWLLNLGILTPSKARKRYWLFIKDYCALIKNFISLTKALITLMRRKRSIATIRHELQAIPADSRVQDDDHVHELVKKLVSFQLLAKRAKQRYEKLGVVRSSLRLLMLLTRIGLARWLTIDEASFAVLGYFENAIGLVKLLNVKKQMIKLSNYSQARQKYEIKKQEEKAQKKVMQIEELGGTGAGTGYPSLYRGTKIRSFVDSATSIAEEEASLEDGLNIEMGPSIESDQQQARGTETDDVLSSVGYSSRSDNYDENLEFEEERKIILKEIKKMNYQRQLREMEEQEHRRKMTVYDPSVGKEDFVPQTIQFNSDFGLQSLFQSNGDLTEITKRKNSTRASRKEAQVKELLNVDSPERFKKIARGNVQNTPKGKIRPPSKNWNEPSD